jgi:hypothetical protein
VLLASILGTRNVYIDLRSDQRHGKDDCVQAAGRMQGRCVDCTFAACVRIGSTRTERRIHKVASAAAAASGEHSNGNEATAEQNIEENGQESEETLAAEAAGEDDSENGIDNTNAADAFNSLSRSC